MNTDIAPALAAWLDALGASTTISRHAERGVVLRRKDDDAFALQLSPPTASHCDQLPPPVAVESVGTLARTILQRLMDLPTAAPVGLICVGPFDPKADVPEPRSKTERPALAWVEGGLLYVCYARATAAWLARRAKHLQSALAADSAAGLVHADRRVTRADWLVDFGRGAYHRARSLKRPRVAHETISALVVGTTDALPLAQVEVLKRLDLQVLRCSARSLVSALRRRRPVALIAAGAPDTLAALGRAREQGVLRKTRVVWVGEAPLDETFEGALHVAPGRRLTARLVDVVGSALGIKQRRHLRADEKSSVSLVTGTATTPSQAQLLNVSESGAKLQVSAPLNPGEKVSLAFDLPTGRVEATARVVRNVTLADMRQVAVEFDPLPTEMANRIAQFVEESEPAANGRRRHPRRVIESLGLKARMRPSGKRTTTYFTVIDLSEGGFLARSAPSVTTPFEPGIVADIVLTLRGKSFACRGGVVRREVAADQVFLAVRFLELDRDAYKVLRHFLSLVPEEAVAT